MYFCATRLILSDWSHILWHDAVYYLNQLLIQSKSLFSSFIPDGAISGETIILLCSIGGRHL